MSEPGADEAGWLAATDGMEMMLAGWRHVGPRQLGCFFLACAETIFRRRPPADRSTALLPLVWDVVDGVTPWESAPAIGDLEEWQNLIQLVGRTRGRERTRVLVQSDSALATNFLACALGHSGMWWSQRTSVVGLDPWHLRQIEVFELRREQIVADHGPLLRDIAGNPFRPVAFAPEWRTEAVVALARTMYESRDFAAMPVLADALDDAGCDHADLLAHCRGPGPHVRGCWVVDLVLGKT